MNSIIKRAEEFARTKHAGQKYGIYDYADYHLKGVVDILINSGVYNENYICVAWLHDTLEDTTTTMQELIDNFGKEISEVVSILTHIKGESYYDYIIRINNSNSLCAMAIKRHDLTFNINECEDSNDLHIRFYRERLDKYKLARYILSN